MPVTPSFLDHVALLGALLDRRQRISEQLEERLMNAREKAFVRQEAYGRLSQVFEACFYGAQGLARYLSELQGQLTAAYVADGFEPVVLERTTHQTDPVDILLRGIGYWDRHRWPGRNGRLAFAGVLYTVFMLRQLEGLTLRVWDDGNGAAEGRLADVQALLDRLNESGGGNVFVRDARWLIQTAQGPLTRHLAPYFRIADRISASFTEERRLGIHKAGVKLAGGHLRSQLRYRSVERGLTVDDPAVLAQTRNSNSMDGALLVRDLVPLLEAYEAACQVNDREGQADLAETIFQGLSADPELFVTRLDLLGPCTAIDYLFLETAGDGVVASPTGLDQRAQVDRYAGLLARLAARLEEDAAAFDPSRRSYSPLGMVYGFCADILSSMALSTLVSQPVQAIGLEDVFDSRGELELKRARAEQWEELSAGSGDRERFEHSIDWASQIFQRATAALHARAQHGSAPNASSVPAARLFAVPRGRTIDSLPQGLLPEGIAAGQEHCVTSDVNRALATGATAFPRSQFLNDRNEARYLASREIDGKWFGVSKTILTELIGQGADALVTDVPERVLEVLRVTCPGLLVVASSRSEDPTPH